MTKRFILTGGSDGLGKEFALLCRAKGIEIVCLSRSKPDYDCVHIPTDLSDEKSIDQAVTLIKEQYATFDALINCAGIIASESIGHLDYMAMERMHAINLFAPAYLISLLMDDIKKNQADILNLGSTSGVKPYPETITYAMSKWGLRGLSVNLQQELKNTKCRVIHMNPGGMQTKLFEKSQIETRDLDNYMKPQDIAGIMLYTLALPKSVEVSEILINRK